MQRCPPVRRHGLLARPGFATKPSDDSDRSGLKPGPVAVVYKAPTGAPYGPQVYQFYWDCPIGADSGPNAPVCVCGPVGEPSRRLLHPSLKPTSRVSRVSSGTTAGWPPVRDRAAPAYSPTRARPTTGPPRARATFVSRTSATSGNALRRRLPSHSSGVEAPAV